MSQKVTQKPLEPSDKSPQSWARWWFAMGCQPEGTVRRLVAECGLAEGEAESIFTGMMEKLYEEVEDLRQNFAARSEALYRDIKNDAAGDWGTRQGAQIELEKLLDLVAFAQTDEGLRSIDVLEAIAFHETLIDDAASTAAQRLRSQRRLMMLLGQTQCRRSGGTALSSSGRARGSGFKADIDSGSAPQPRTNALSDAHCRTSRQCHPRESNLPGSTAGLPPGTHSTQTSDASQVPLPFVPKPLPLRPLTGDPETDAATRREVLAALEQEAQELDAECTRLIHEEGLSPDDALERLEPLIHENSLRQMALRDMIEAHETAVDPSPSPASPIPRAQGPPA